MPLPLMPKATAVWLVENTALTFEQIAAFCGLHSLEIKAIADGEVAVGMVGLDPIANGQLSKEEIERAEKDEHVRNAQTATLSSSIATAGDEHDHAATLFHDAAQDTHNAEVC